MGEERPADWYDERYPDSAAYKGDVRDSRFYPVWVAALLEVIRSRRQGGVLVDLGCGPGHLSTLVPSCYVYRGYDFSPVAIDMARARNPAAEFHVWDATKDPLPRGSVYVATEFLEHVEGDLQVLSQIPRGKPFVGTLPMSDSKGHVRWFETLEQVRRRYGQVLRIRVAQTLDPIKVHVFAGVRR